MNDSPSQQRFEDLVRNLLDEDSSQVVNPRQLEEAMRDDPALLNEYLDQVELDTFLAWEFGREESSENTVENLTNFAEQNTKPPSTALWLAVAAMIAFFFGIGFFTAKTQNHSGVELAKSNSAVAVLIDSEDCVWESSNDALISFGTPFQSGQIISISSGIGRIAMKGNAGISVEGPAQIELVSSQEARVVYGRVSAYAPEEAIGFRLVTPDVEIVDLGTRFAANVDRNGKTEVHVFEGEVSVKGRKEKRDAPGEVIVEGQARLYSDGGTRQSKIMVSPESFTDPPILEQLLRTSATNRFHPLSYLKTGNSKQTDVNPSVIAIQDFSSSEGNRGQLPDGLGFAEPPWMASTSYTRIIPRVLSHSGKSSAGGHFLIRGRELSEATVPTRLRRKLMFPLPAEFYFSIKAKYRGLDSDDFFALWIDSHDREDSSHGFVPNIGIRKGAFYLRLHRDRLSTSKAIPKDAASFFLVGHYSRNATNDRETISFWANPSKSGADGAIPEPDSTRLETRSKNEAPVFQYIGLRMGQYTEVSDELLIEKILITSEWNALFE